MWQGVCPWPLMLSVYTNTRWVTLLPSGPGSLVFLGHQGDVSHCHLDVHFRSGRSSISVLCVGITMEWETTGNLLNIRPLEPMKGQVLSLGSSWALPAKQGAAPDPARSLGRWFSEPVRMVSFSGPHRCLLVHEFPCTLLFSYIYRIIFLLAGGRLALSHGSFWIIFTGVLCVSSGPWYLTLKRQCLVLRFL